MSLAHRKVSKVNKKTTSSRVASSASDVLRNPNASAIAKSLAASALSQAQAGRQTGGAMEAKASAVLRSDKYSAETKTLAATVVAQSDRDR